MLDDTGFGHLGCYGSPIRTPNLDKLAKNGFLYNYMHTTALCSPSRLCMLTGRNHHSNGMACNAEGSEGQPGSNGAIPFECRVSNDNGRVSAGEKKWKITVQS